MSRIYVIKLNQKWVEIRGSTLPLTGIIHRITKTVKYNNYIDREDSMESIEWRGGKHLTTMKFGAYTKLASEYGLGIPTLRKPYEVLGIHRNLFKETE